MRVIHAAALTAAALLLTTVASAQGLGDAAAAAREKRKAEPAKPAKVYTEGDIGQSMTAVSTARDLPPSNAPSTSGSTSGGGGQATSGTPGAVEGQPSAEGQDPAEGAAPAEVAPVNPEAAEAEADAQAQASAAWRQKLDQARKEEAVYKDVIDKVQVQVNGTSGLYSPGRAANLAFLEENKQKLAETQAKIAALENEGRANGYR